ncbi:MAG: AraC family transcriptional regulator [Lachnospiraceae bacterium]|jgi:AraC-like DNA-binding protein|nr:AraC family transcriptional regulator [Lachnospiraceae bacterium]
MDLDFNEYIPELDYYIHRLCTPNWEIKESVIPFMDLTYVVAGQARYWIDGKEYLVKKGDLLCIPKGARRKALPVPDDLMECYAVNAFLRNQSGEDATLPIPIRSHIGHVPMLVSSFHEIQEVWQVRGFGYMMKTRGIILDIMYQVLNLLLNDRASENVDLRVKICVRYISEHFAEPLTVNTLAQHFKLHPVYFGNLFRSSLGMPFKKYLLSVRMNTADTLLRSGEYSVSEVAFQCGYADVFYFSKVFKEHRGVSPSGLLPPDRKRA